MAALKIIKPGESEAYGFDPKVERRLARRLCEAPNMWATLGRYIDPDLLGDRAARTIIKTCGHVAKQTGRGPTSVDAVDAAMTVLQNEAGVLPADERIEALSAVAELEERELAGDRGPSDEEFLAIVGSVVRDRVVGEAVDALLSARGKGSDLGPHLVKIEQADRVAREEAPAVGVGLWDDAVWDRICALRRSNLLPLGIRPIDDSMDGTARQQLGCIAADTNVGKSHVILHVAGTWVVAGLRVVYVTTEQSVEENLLRMVSWMTGIPKRRVAARDKEAVARMRQLSTVHGIGAIEFLYLPWRTTVPAMWDAVDYIVQNNPAFGGQLDAVCVDIADRLGSHNKSDRNGYEIMGTVYECLRDGVVQRDVYGLTGSQLKERDHKGPPRIEDLADSRNKGRSLDWCVTMWEADDDPESRMYHIAKMREGSGKGDVLGPVPTNLDCARIAPVPVDLWEAA